MDGLNVHERPLVVLWGFQTGSTTVMYALDRDGMLWSRYCDEDDDIGTWSRWERSPNPEGK